MTGSEEDEEMEGSGSDEEQEEQEEEEASSKKTKGKKAEAVPTKPGKQEDGTFKRAPKPNPFKAAIEKREAEKKAIQEARDVRPFDIRHADTLLCYLSLNETNIHPYVSSTLYYIARTTCQSRRKEGS